MILYRALDNLSIGIRQYQVFNVGRLKETTRALLEQRGFIAPVNAPPLYGVDGWQARAEILAETGIETLADVVLCSGVPAGVEPAAWATWQAEAVALLSMNQCVNCRR